ncbi:YbjQ family protein [Gammaproteobacteria bacterium]|nr:YbjQ family protein [Gammaproteobacteria bacterium]MDC0402179.1 YbjQ family protein [Gammaproteobacteria bacterium]MDC1074975.1 YbjQ family protein [Gammaproteobacteria bacterium]
MTENFLVVSANDLAGIEIKEHIGIVQGSTVRSRNIGSDIFARLKNLVGGELVGYSKLLTTSREQAYKRMIEDAEAKGADAIVCFRFQTSTITDGASEILAYGTGVKYK